MTTDSLSFKKNSQFVYIPLDHNGMITNDYQQSIFQVNFLNLANVT